MLGGQHLQHQANTIGCGCILVKPAYSITGWADACSVGVPEVLRAVKGQNLITRRTSGGVLLVTAEDGLDWLRKLAIA